MIANREGLEYQFSTSLNNSTGKNQAETTRNDTTTSESSNTPKTEEEIKQEILEEERKIQELEKQLYSEKQAMSMIFKASGSSFGFKRRNDDDTNNPNVPQLSPEESLKARVLGYKLASLALVYGTLLNVGAAILFILICYFIFDIKTVLDLKNVIRRFIRGSDYQHPDENLTPEQRVEKMTQLFKSTIVKQEQANSEKEDKN